MMQTELSSLRSQGDPHHQGNNDGAFIYVKNKREEKVQYLVQEMG